MRPAGTHRRGFTLVELLVVLAILAILSGLLLPGLRRGRQAARRSQCLGQVRQLAMATLLYGEDFGGTLPGILPGTRDRAAPLLRADHLASASARDVLVPAYVPDAKGLFSCPQLRAGAEAASAAAVWTPSAYQWFLGPRHGWVLLATVPDPCAFPLVVDPVAGLHGVAGRVAGYLDGHAEPRLDGDLENERLDIIANPAIRMDPEIGCRLYPDECGGQ